MKYFAIGLHAIGIGILVWVLAAFLQPKALAIPPVQAGRAAPPATPETLKQDADGAQRALASLAVLKAHFAQGNAATALPLGSKMAAASLIGQAPVVDLSAGALKIMPKRNLTLVLQSKQAPRAMIDGLLVKPGDPLPDNGRVAEISDDRVVLIEKYGRQTLTISSGRARWGTPTVARSN